MAVDRLDAVVTFAVVTSALAPDCTSLPDTGSTLVPKFSPSSASTLLPSSPSAYRSPSVPVSGSTLLPWSVLAVDFTVKRFGELVFDS